MDGCVDEMEQSGLDGNWGRDSLSALHLWFLGGSINF